MIRTSPEGYFNKLLGQYEPEVDKLLDRVFDEYGLIVCGWSATWDIALRNAILRGHNRRFSLFWASKGEPSVEARSLISFRQGTLVPIDSADQFFGELESKLEALNTYAQPHPLSAELAVIALKKYIAEDKYRIELHDLLMREAETRVKALGKLSMTEQNLQISGIFERLKIYETASDILIRLVVTGAYWGRSEHQRLWGEIVRRLFSLCSISNGMTHLLSLCYYPACLTLYAAGISAVAAGNYESLRSLLRDTTVRVSGKEQPLALAVLPWSVLDLQIARQMPGYERRYTPINDRLFDNLKEPLQAYVPAESDYSMVFDRFEYLLAVVHLDFRIENGDAIYAPVGRFGWKRSYDGQTVGQQLCKELEETKSAWPPLKAGLFSSEERFLELQKVFREQILSQVRW
jgi:hypothetical protein